MKKLVSLLLTLVMVLSLATLPAAAKNDLGLDGYEAISIEFEERRIEGTQILAEYDPYIPILRPDETDAFNAIRKGETITITHTGTDGENCYLMVKLTPYKKITTPITGWNDEEEITLTEGYYHEGDFLYLADASTRDSDALSAGSGLYWNSASYMDSWSAPEEQKILRAGESVTISIPNDSSDTIYQLKVTNFYPDHYGYEGWRWVALKYSDLEATKYEVPAFTDVPADAYFATPVVWAVEQGITNGTTATAFSPNSTCTTAQILTFLWRANGKHRMEVYNPFSDVKEDAYYYNAALWAYENDMVDGDLFNGGSPCTRAQTVTYLWKLAGCPDAGESTFTDVPAGSQYSKAVAWAVKEGITNGTTPTTFAPNNTCTRGQIVTFLYRDLAN